MEWTVLGYRHTRELGSGASGRVVLALHEATDTPVAIKYLGDELRADPDFLAEFRTEARLLGDLASPYVVRLYEYVEGPEGAAIVMELVDGIALRALLRQAGATGPEAALVVLKGSLLGLAAAHALGVVHRDYKPENVLVATDGSSKLVDFGIAVRTGEDGRIAGTPPYMAPEQWAGEAASPAADVYAATATFFECLTGSRPYPGTNVAELVVQHTTASIPDALAPESVRPLIRRGLAKDARERPQSAAAFVAELEAVAGAAYGSDWEERGQRELAALAALLPLLFPSARDVPGSPTALAATVLGPPAPDPVPVLRRRIRKRRIVWGGVAGAVLVGMIGGVASGVLGSGGHSSARPSATPRGVTSSPATPRGVTSSPATPAASGTASASVSPSTSARQTADRSPTGRSAPTSPPTVPSTTTSPPPSTEIAVPSVIGDTVPQAQNVLTKAGFSSGNIAVDPTCDQNDPGVYAQDPSANTKALPSTTITLHARGDDCLQYANVFGTNAAAARQALTDAGFTKVSLSQACSQGYGTVDQQSPTYTGQYLKADTPIELTASCADPVDSGPGDSGPRVR
ncbi:protein kinase domain-containing protein [Streptomyces sp. JNUCC 63]